MRHTLLFAGTFARQKCGPAEAPPGSSHSAQAPSPSPKPSEALIAGLTAGCAGLVATLVVTYLKRKDILMLCGKGSDSVPLRNVQLPTPKLPTNGLIVQVRGPQCCSFPSVAWLKHIARACSWTRCGFCLEAKVSITGVTLCKASLLADPAVTRPRCLVDACMRWVIVLTLAAQASGPHLLALHMLWFHLLSY